MLFLLYLYKVGGLGNIYAAEALFRGGVDPRRAVGTLRRPRLAKLHAAIAAGGAWRGEFARGF